MSVDLERSLCLCWVVYSTWGVIYFHTPLLAGSTLRALVQTCSDRTRCSIPFSSMNYRQRPCSPQPQQPTSQAQQKLTALVVFWKHELSFGWITDIWICSSWHEWYVVIIVWLKTSSSNIIQVGKMENTLDMWWTHWEQLNNWIIFEWSPYVLSLCGVFVCAD